MPDEKAIVLASGGALAAGQHWGDMVLSDQFRIANQLYQSGIFPAFKSAQQIIAAMAVGNAVGLPAVMALQFLYVVKGRVGWQGDGALAVMRNSGMMKNLRVEYEDREDDKGIYRVCIVSSQRKGDTERVTDEFTQRMAERRTVSYGSGKAGPLYTKPGPWCDDPDNMLHWRAIGRHFKRQYSDVLMGTPLAEELADYPPTSSRGDPPDGKDPIFESIIDPKNGKSALGKPVEGLGEPPEKPAEAAKPDDDVVDADYTATPDSTPTPPPADKEAAPDKPATTGGFARDGLSKDTDALIEQGRQQAKERQGHF